MATKKRPAKPKSKAKAKLAPKKAKAKPVTPDKDPRTVGHPEPTPLAEALEQLRPLTEPQKKIGRPAKFDSTAVAAIVDLVIARVSTGTPLMRCMRELTAEMGEGNAPSLRTFYNWIEESPAFTARFAHAREDGYDQIATETLAIADDGRNDWMEKLDKDGQGIGWMLNGEHVQRSKLRIETRLKLLAKWDPKRYGDKQDVNMTVTTLPAALAAIRATVVPEIVDKSPKKPG